MILNTYFFHDSSGYANARRCYVARAFRVLIAWAAEYQPGISDFLLDADAWIHLYIPNSHVYLI